MSGEEDPKEVARIERKQPGVDRLLRQFLNTDGPKGTSEAYRAHFAESMRKDTPAFGCDECGYLAHSLADLHRHETADHTHCRKCGNPFTLEGDGARAEVRNTPSDTGRRYDPETGARLETPPIDVWAAQLCNRCAS